jgi:hypothetical protein
MEMSCQLHYPAALLRKEFQVTTGKKQGQKEGGENQGHPVQAFGLGEGTSTILFTLKNCNKIA